VDFLKIAEGFGVRTVDLDTSDHPQTTLAEALNSTGPCMIHVSIDMTHKVYPMVPPGAANKVMVGG
jgi:acetolactate synthase-1/2/3 large subunit